MVKKALAPELNGGYQERPEPSPVERGLKTWTAPPMAANVALALNTYTLFSRTLNPMAPTHLLPSTRGWVMKTRSKYSPLASAKAFLAASATMILYDSPLIINCQRPSWTTLPSRSVQMGGPP